MSRCVHPLSGWWSRKPNDGGHDHITFRMRDGHYDRPIDIPCGRCVGCVQDKAQAWSVRCYHESTVCPRNSFATLTYRDPCPEKLDKAELQQFFKRVRAAGIRFRFFAAGEYGERTHRPHYHVIFFGEDFRDGSVSISDKYYISPRLLELWGLGHVVIGAAEPATIFYTCGYTLKNLGDPDCFHLASRRPFLGAKWLEQFHDDAIRNGFVTIDGSKFPVPPTYLHRPEYGVQFDWLRERRRLFGEARTGAERVAWRDSLRSAEVCLQAGASSRRGDL